MRARTNKQSLKIILHLIEKRNRVWKSTDGFLKQKQRLFTKNNVLKSNSIIQKLILLIRKLYRFLKPVLYFLIVFFEVSSNCFIRNVITRIPIIDPYYDPMHRSCQKWTRYFFCYATVCFLFHYLSEKFRKQNQFWPNKISPNNSNLYRKHCIHIYYVSACLMMSRILMSVLRIHRLSYVYLYTCIAKP